MINWNDLNSKDTKIIHKIARRASLLAKPNYDLMTIDMDVSACHLSNPLKLQELLEADDFNFVHDVFGIMRHIDKDTGKLQNCFSPRYSA